MVKYPQGELTVRSKLKQLIAQKEMESGRRIQQQDIAEATGLDDNTISRWMSPRPFKRLEVDTVVKLCRWLECGLDELLYIDKVG